MIGMDTLGLWKNRVQIRYPFRNSKSVYLQKLPQINEIEQHVYNATQRLQSKLAILRRTPHLVFI